MSPRLLLLRRALVRPSRSTPSLSPLASSLLVRTFAHSTALRSNIRTRPQLPFLSSPTTTSCGTRVRYLTTERKAKIKYDIKLGVKYTGYIWIAFGCLSLIAFVVKQESLERQFPTPHEWTFVTRMRFRYTQDELNLNENRYVVDWVRVVQWIKHVVTRLEDPNIDGQGVRDASPDRPPGTKDISAMPEPWRRGYYEAMMLYAKAAENVDGWVVDRTRNEAFPGDTVVGPSNPNPAPLSPGTRGQPKEEDCEIAFESPNDIYLRILSTEGWTSRQRLEASLAYASWLEFKGITGPASIVYEDAVNQTASEQRSSPVDFKTWTLDDSAGLPSGNLLSALTAYAEFRGRHGDVSAALPIFVSILKARRSLPAPDPNLVQNVRGSRSKAGPLAMITSLLGPPAYPSPPDDGTAPPVRDAKEMCEEAALSLHIGEIIYTSQTASREEGLSWTREAVDMAEEQLHKLKSSKTDRPAQHTCRDCLTAGLSNWQTMVARLAREEAAKKEEAERPSTETAGTTTSGGGWFGLWGGAGESAVKKEDLSRWAAEEKVIQERERRAKDLLEELEAPASGFGALFSA